VLALTVGIELALADSTLRAALVTGMELALYTSNRLKVYLEYYPAFSASLADDNFRTTLVNLYAHVLHFLAHAIQTQPKNRAARTLQALWNPESLADFEEKCDTYLTRAAEDLNNCDRLSAEAWRDELRTRLQSLVQIHDKQTVRLAKLQDTADLGRLATAKGATYDSSAEGELPRCLLGTRTALLDDIMSWTADRTGKRIFWLCGKAGTGKSTISRTIAQKLDDKGFLGATFFFKRGREHRSNANLFFPTISFLLSPGNSQTKYRA